VLNPLRSEEEAFRALVWTVAVLAAVVALVLVGRALLSAPARRPPYLTVSLPCMPAWR
jgi:hypothetical protein